MEEYKETELCGAVYEDLVANSWMRDNNNNCKELLSYSWRSYEKRYINHI